MVIFGLVVKESGDTFPNCKTTLTMASENVCKMIISTYNCKHFNEGKLAFIQNPFANSDILLLQEHCLFESTFDQFCKVDKNLSFTATSPMNEHEILLVRPYGGCAILWNSNVNYNIVKLNVYMPCDLRVVGCNSMLYTELLNEISSFLHQHDPMYYVIGGDFNTDFSTESHVF